MRGVEEAERREPRAGCYPHSLQEGYGSGHAGLVSAASQSSMRSLGIVPERLPPTRTLVRLERIAELQRAIAEGRYRVSSADLAQTLIDRMLKNRPPTV